MTRMRRMTRSAWLISKTTCRRAACRLLVCRMRRSFAAKPPMTKRDVRALVVSALHLKPNGVVWDIGAGTGSVSVECARQCPLGEVYAVEMKDEALDLIRRNAERFHALNLRVVPGRALEVLSALPAPDAVFLGGTTGEAEAIVELFARTSAPDSAGRNRRHDGKRAGASAPDAADGGF